MRDRDMLGVPIDYYRRPVRAPAEEERPPLSRRARLLLRATGSTAALLFVVLFVLFGLPLFANWNEFALPGAGGLPWQFRYDGHTYRNTSTCAHRRWCGNTPNYLTMDEIARRGHAPLVQVTVVPTLFGLGHAAFVPTYLPTATDVADTRGTVCRRFLLYVQDGDRFLPYSPHGDFTTCDKKPS